MKIDTLNLNDMPAKLKSLVDDQGAKTYLGSMMTTRGLLVLLFSHRLNQDFPLLIKGTDSSRILTKVFEALGTAKATT